jgi:hypothetical protein
MRADSRSTEEALDEQGFLGRGPEPIRDAPG